jgi:hypothetical protein
MIKWLKEQTPQQRHFVALKLNWDYAESTLDWIIAQEECDLATAVELFWRSDDSELIRYPTRDLMLKEAPYFEWYFDFVSSIMLRAHSVFYKNRKISYNLQPDRLELIEGYEELESECRARGLPWIAPQEFRVAFKGEDVDPHSESSPYMSNEVKDLLAGLGTFVG